MKQLLSQGFLELSALGKRPRSACPAGMHRPSFFSLAPNTATGGKRLAPPRASPRERLALQVKRSSLGEVSVLEHSCPDFTAPSSNSRKMGRGAGAKAVECPQGQKVEGGGSSDCLHLSSLQPLSLQPQAVLAARPGCRISLLSSWRFGPSLSEGVTAAMGSVF